MENTNTTKRLEAAELDVKISNGTAALTFKDLFTIEQHNKFRNEYMRKFDEAWKAEISCANIATIRGVTTSSVVSYINHDLENRTAHIAESIEAIGAGKPKLSERDKLRKLGYSDTLIDVMLKAKELSLANKD